MKTTKNIFAMSLLTFALLACFASNVALTTLKRFAFVTLATSDEYVLGALTLLSSLREHRHALSSPSRSSLDFDRDVDFVALVESLSSEAEFTLQRFGWSLHRVARLSCWSPATTSANVPRYLVTCDKLHAFALAQYERVIYIDADSLVLSTDALLALFVEHRDVVLRAVPSPSSASPDDDHASDDLRVLRDASIDPTDAKLVKRLDSTTTTTSGDNVFAVIKRSPKAVEDLFQTAILVRSGCMFFPSC